MFPSQNDSMRHLMMFETFRSQQEGMRHLNRIMAEDHRRMMNPPRPSVYRANAGSPAFLRCPACRAEMDQHPDLNMSSCGFCGLIVTYDGLSRPSAPPLYRSAENRRFRVKDRTYIIILFSLLAAAGIAIIFLPIEKISLFGSAENSKAWTVVFSLILGGAALAVLYGLIRLLRWIAAYIRSVVKAKRDSRYYF